MTAEQFRILDEYSDPESGGTMDPVVREAIRAALEALRDEGCAPKDVA